MQGEHGADRRAFNFILFLAVPMAFLIMLENLSTAVLLCTVVLMMMVIGRVPMVQIGKLLGLLESPDELRTALSESSEAGESDLHIKIGSDESGLEDVALVTAKVQIPGGQTASISLVGPKRMDYDKAMGLLSYVSERLDEYFVGKKGENK